MIILIRSWGDQRGVLVIGCPGYSRAPDSVLKSGEASAGHSATHKAFIAESSPGDKSDVLSLSLDRRLHRLAEA